ncbi:hypothetical protein [Ciceribacter sp. L1K22]|uniref:hypothetical protein n=1 Tax=Ciceribacter sp. L1K22 TaxID=2820275 RepID=UPI001ABE0726|nr:hypothetical protein [Ciceribacter sp. L1K22]
MILLTAMGIGIAAGLMRSVTVIALVAVLICVAFAVAMLTSPAAPPMMSLLWAIAGYNLGLIDLVIGLFVVDRLRTA